MTEISGPRETETAALDSQGEAEIVVTEREDGSAGDATAASLPADRDAGDSLAELGAVLQRLERSLEDGFADLQRSFQDKLAYDRAKDQQISLLHDELQEHKLDLLGRAKRPLLQGMIRLHDDLGKVVASLRRKPDEDLTAERLFQVLEGFREDLEMILGQNGVETFQTPAESFDPARQTSLKTEPTTEESRVGTIAARLRPGFNEGEVLLQRERVAVYVLSREEVLDPGGSEDPTAVSPLVTD
jgi:molecular chaperone GrpE (heat shock protein)